jgi:hypothetical protein
MEQWVRWDGAAVARCNSEEKKWRHHEVSAWVYASSNHSKNIKWTQDFRDRTIKPLHKTL